MAEHQDTILVRQVLEELREDLEDDFEDFLRRFRGHARDSLTAMEVALRDGDCAEAGRLAHALKGTAGYVGGVRLVAGLEELQRLGQGDWVPPMVTVLTRARGDFEELEGLFRQVLGES